MILVSMFITLISFLFPHASHNTMIYRKQISTAGRNIKGRKLTSILFDRVYEPSVAEWKCRHPRTGQ